MLDISEGRQFASEMTWAPELVEFRIEGRKACDCGCGQPDRIAFTLCGHTVSISSPAAVDAAIKTLEEAPKIVGGTLMARSGPRTPSIEAAHSGRAADCRSARPGRPHRRRTARRGRVCVRGGRRRLPPRRSGWLTAAISSRAGGECASSARGGRIDSRTYRLRSRSIERAVDKESGRLRRLSRVYLQLRTEVLGVGYGKEQAGVG